MAKIPIKLRIGDKLSEDSERVVDMLDEAYEDITENLNEKPQIIIKKNADPTPNDFLPNIATFWLNQATPSLWIMSNKTSSSATWNQIL